MQIFYVVLPKGMNEAFFHSIRSTHTNKTNNNEKSQSTGRRQASNKIAWCRNGGTVQNMDGETSTCVVHRRQQALRERHMANKSRIFGNGHFVISPVWIVTEVPPIKTHKE